MRRLACTLALSLSLAACAGIKTERPENNPLPQDTIKGEGLFSGESGNILDAFRDKTKTEAVGIGVNGYLWRASLEAVSFMPILQADSSGGVILTDWYSNPKTPGERAKVSVYILGKEFTVQALRVSVFKQIKDSKGNWGEAKPEAATARALEDTILTEARKLRVADQARKKK